MNSERGCVKYRGKRADVIEFGTLSSDIATKSFVYLVTFFIGTRLKRLNEPLQMNVRHAKLKILINCREVFPCLISLIFLE